MPRVQADPEYSNPPGHQNKHKDMDPGRAAHAERQSFNCWADQHTGCNEWDFADQYACLCGCHTPMIPVLVYGEAKTGKTTYAPTTVVIDMPMQGVTERLAAQAAANAHTFHWVCKIALSVLSHMGHGHVGIL